jgi:hypothetical protein
MPEVLKKFYGFQPVDPVDTSQLHRKKLIVIRDPKHFHPGGTMLSKAKQARHDHDELRERPLPGGRIKVDRQRFSRWIYNSFPTEVAKSFVRHLDHLGWDQGTKAFTAMVEDRQFSTIRAPANRR